MLCALLAVLLLGGCTPGSNDRHDRAAATPPASAGPSSGPTTSATAPSSAGAASVAPAARAAAGGGAGGAPFCGPTRYAEEIQVQRWATGQFRIEVWPTSAARHARDTDAATAELWRDIQACVTGLAGDTADSLHDQLECHEHLALVPALHGGQGFATGTTFDLESWRPPLVPSNFDTWVRTHCGNTLGTDPTTHSIGTSRPDGRPSTQGATTDPERR